MRQPNNKMKTPCKGRRRKGSLTGISSLPDLFLQLLVLMQSCGVLSRFVCIAHLRCLSHCHGYKMATRGLGTGSSLAVQQSQILFHTQNQSSERMCHLPEVTQLARGGLGPAPRPPETAQLVSPAALRGLPENRWAAVRAVGRGCEHRPHPPTWKVLRVTKM